MASKSVQDRLKQKLLESFKDRFKRGRLKRRKPSNTVIVINGQKLYDKTTGKPVKPKKNPTAKGTAAAKKAWETRRANAEDPVQAERERQEALRVLDELAKNRPPATEE